MTHHRTHAFDRCRVSGPGRTITYDNTADALAVPKRGEK